MKIKKLLLVFIIMILIPSAGCMKQPTDEISIKDEMLKYMEEKYDEKFEFVIGDTQLWTSNYSEMIVSSEKFPGESIYVRKNGETGEITDNYMAYILQADIEKRLSDELYSIYGENKVFYLVPIAISSKVNTKTRVESYMETGLNELSFAVFVYSNPESKDADFEKLKQLLLEKKYLIDLRIIYFDYTTFININKTNNHKYAGDENIILRGTFHTNSDGEIRYIEWRPDDNE